MNLRGKVIVVTGGSSGLGEQICYEAAKKGATVVVCARRIQLISKVKDTCEDLSGQEAFCFQLDISDSQSIDHVFEKIQEKVGLIDVLVNNAGFGLFQSFVDFDLNIAEKMFEVNILGLMYFTQKVAIQMSERRTGHILNVASMAGKIATAKSTVYSATKSAVLGFSNALRLEMRSFGIKVTTINPGPIKTHFFDFADQSGNYLSSVNAIVLDPQKLAREIVLNFGKNKREINQPLILNFAAKLYALFPNLGDKINIELFDNK